MKKILSVILACMMIFGVMSSVVFADDAYTKSVSISVESDSSSRMMVVPVFRTPEGVPVVDEDSRFIVLNPASKACVTADKISVLNGKPVFNTTEIYSSAADKAAAASDINTIDFFEIPSYGKIVFFKKTVSENDGEVSVELTKNNNPYIPAVNHVAQGSDFMFALTAIGSYAFDQTVIIKAYPSSFMADIIKDREVGEKLSPDNDGLYKVSDIQEDTLIKCYNLQDNSLAGIKDFLFNLGNFFRRIIQWFFGIRTN